MSFAPLSMPARSRAGRRATALAAGILALGLAGCSETGFDAQTNAVYDPGAGTNASLSEVPVLNALVVADEDGSGVVSATLTSRVTEDVQLTGVTASADGEPIETSFAQPLDVPANTEPAPLKLGSGDETAIVVSGEAVQPGRFVDLTLEFSTGQMIELGVPVVARDSETEGLYEEVVEAPTTTVTEETPELAGAEDGNASD